MDAKPGVRSKRSGRTHAEPVRRVLTAWLHLQEYESRLLQLGIQPGLHPLYRDFATHNDNHAPA